VRASEAQQLAKQWIAEHRETILGYRGAYLAGSLCWLDDDDPVSDYSDIDVMLIVEDEEMRTKPGKFEYRGGLIEVSVSPISVIRDVEATVSQGAIAASIARNRILDDPGHLLRPAFDWIAAEFPREHRVIERLDAIQASIAKRVTSIDDSAPFHDQAMWVFPAGVTTHLLLTAGLGNPTVRRRFVETRRLLDAYGEPEMLDLLLHFVGSDAVTAEMARRHFARLVPVYDATAALGATGSRWVSDVSVDARRISIGGTQELLDQGYHREAMWWIVATFTRCLNVIATTDNEALFRQADAAFRALMDDLGLASVGDLRARAGEIVASLPAIREVANRVLARNPEVIRT
jgi:hypothetical protein